MIPLLALGFFALLLSSKRSSASAKAPSSSSAPMTPAAAAAKVAKETQEILDGKREEFSAPAATDAELERAKRAVALARQKEARTPKPAAAAAAAPGKAPAGTDLALAKGTAAKLAAHLKQKGRDHYDRQAVKLWQTRAGIAPDGIYGRQTAAALKYFGAPAPAPFFAQGVASYKPPPG